MGLLERHGEVRCRVLIDAKKKPTLQGHIRANVEAGSSIHTDEFSAYWEIDRDYNLA
jgi:hypothetical protein